MPGLTWRAKATHLSTSNCTYGSRSILFRSMNWLARNMCGYLIGLSSPSVTETHHDLGELAQVEEGRADQVADVFDHHQRFLGGIELPSARSHQSSVEMAAGAGVDLHDPRAGGMDALGVARGLLVAFDDRQGISSSSGWCAPEASSCPHPAS